VTVRTRYAPSPTGAPHVGNIRTALFDYLLARHFGGQFIIRIEDTDRARSVPGAIDAICDSLSWLGLDWDEGPQVGGPYGPYVQSERLEYYTAAAERLLGQGDAYHCWCSSERLEALRAEQARNKQPPRYDRRCRTDEGRAASRKEAKAEGRSAVVRFKTPLSGEITFDDAIHGSTTFDLATIDDFVLLKSDGYPVYALAYIVDDEMMKISHVLRGDEWLPSAPRHLLVYRALAIEPPVIAHLPRILGPDGSKLSKRHGATSVFDYRDEGYLPDAMFNFLGLMGWSLDDKTEIISRDQFIEHFTLDRVVKNPAIFNVEKLRWMNGVYIRDMPEEQLTNVFAGRLERDLPETVRRPLDRGLIARIAPLIRERVKLLSEVAGYCDFFFVEKLTYARDELLGKQFASRADAAHIALERAAGTAGGVDPWQHEPIEAAFRALADNLALKPGDLFSLVRVAVTGRRVTPPLFESMEILGKSCCVDRLTDATAKT
jgi:glutamyl-tRNA synthetase